ncbi:hypothetical protein [Klebsiella pneumoniae]|uniref:hypothetical protein n=1 Tax=Klebsiella pneumoniae TaxID=573 RepID=UPI003F922154
MNKTKGCLIANFATVPRIINATLGFKSMKTAYATIKGIEVMRALRKGQASAFYYGDPLGEMRLVSRVFEM